MELIQKTDNKITFKAKIEESLANLIRRYVNEVPTLAISEVEISKNNSPLYDETIAHRLGLVPLKAEKAFKEDTEMTLKLSYKKEGAVHSGELKGDCKVVFEKIPITYLDKNQEISLNANVKVGRGSTHSKHTPGLIYYRNVKEISLDKDALEEVKRIFPSAEVKEKGNKIIILDDGIKEMGDVLEGIADEVGKKAEVKMGDELIVTLESFGQLSPAEIFKKIIEESKKDLNELAKKLK